MSNEIKGRDANGVWRSVKVSETGELVVSGATGAGASASTSANQDTQIVEAQATNNKLDTANTSLTAIDTGLDNVNTNLGTLDTSVQATNTKIDELKALVDTVEALLADIEANTDATATATGEATEAKQDDTIAKLEDIRLLIDTVEALLSSIDTKTATETTLAAVNTKLNLLATENTLADVDLKLADVATETTLLAVNNSINNVNLDTTNIDSRLASIEQDIDSLLKSKSGDVAWDYREFSYVASGNGEGEIETISFYSGAVGSGTLLRTVTYTYDANGNIIREVKS